MWQFVPGRFNDMSKLVQMHFPADYLANPFDMYKAIRSIASNM